MAIDVVAACGFEIGSAAASDREWSTTAFVGTASIVSTPVKTGDRSLRVNPTGASQGYCEVRPYTAAGVANTTLNVATVWCAFHFRYATKPASGDEQICIVYNTSNAQKIALRLNSSGKLSLYDQGGSLVATGSTVLSADTWYSIELQVGTGASATVTVRVNGSTEITSATVNTTTANNAFGRFGKVLNQGSNSVDYFYDDIVLATGDWIGKAKVLRLDPDGNGNYTAWTNDYQSVDDSVALGGNDGDTTYVSTSTNGNKESLSCEACGLSSVDILAVKVFGVWRYSGSSAAARLGLRSGSTDSPGSTQALGTYSFLNQLIYTTDPSTGSAWTVSGVDAAEPYIEHQQAQSREVRCTMLGLMVIYVDIEAGTYTAAVSLASNQTTLSASASSSAPEFSASVSLSSQPASLSAISSFSPGVKTASVNLQSQSLTLAASVSSSTPVYDASADLQSQSSALAASAQSSPPAFNADGVLHSQSAMLAASVSFDSGSVDAVADLQPASSLLFAFASHSPPAFNASAGLQSQPSSLAASSQSAEPTFTAVVDLDSQPSILSAAVSFDSGSMQAAASLAGRESQLAAIAGFVPPEFSAFVNLVSLPSFLSAIALSSGLQVVAVVSLVSQVSVLMSLVEFFIEAASPTYRPAVARPVGDGQRSVAGDNKVVHGSVAVSVARVPARVASSPAYRPRSL